MARCRVDDGEGASQCVALSPHPQLMQSGLKRFEGDEARLVGRHPALCAVVELPAYVAFHLVALGVAERAVYGKQRVAPVAFGFTLIEIAVVA